MVHIHNNDYDNNLGSTTTQDIKVGEDENAQKYGSLTAMAITIIIISARQDDYKVVAWGDNDDEDGFAYKGDADDHILWFTLMALVVIIISVPHPHKISQVLLTDPTRIWTMGSKKYHQRWR